MTLTARLVDPRDINVEEAEPTYRVAFWSSDGSRCRDYDVDGVDGVSEVIAWAEEQVRPSETYVLGVRWASDLGSGASSADVVFLRLVGDAPSGHTVGGRTNSRA